MQSHHKNIDDYKRDITLYEASIVEALNAITDEYYKHDRDAKVERQFKRFLKNKTNKYIQKEAQLAIFDWARDNASKLHFLPPLLDKIYKLNIKRAEAKNKIVQQLKEQRTLIEHEITTHKSILNITANISRLTLRLSSHFSDPIRVQQTIQRLKKILSESEEELNKITKERLVKKRPLQTLEQLQEELLTIETKIRRYGGRILPQAMVVTPEEKIPPDITKKEKGLDAKQVIQKQKFKRTLDKIYKAGGIELYLNKCKIMLTPDALLLELEHIKNALENEYNSHVNASLLEHSTLNLLQKNIILVKTIIDETNKKAASGKIFKQQI